MICISSKPVYRTLKTGNPYQESMPLDFSTPVSYNIYMRRTDRQITDPDTIIDIIRHNTVLRLGLCLENQPYIVPVNFGYEYTGGTHVFYIHGAGSGQKVEYAKSNPNVCIEIDYQHSLTHNGNPDNPCGYGFQYTSIIGYGVIEKIKNPQDKIHGLNILMKQLTGRNFSFTSAQIESVTVFCITLREISAKSCRA